jgi:hypothetical protein
VTVLEFWVSFPTRVTLLHRNACVTECHISHLAAPCAPREHCRVSGLNWYRSHNNILAALHVWGTAILLCVCSCKSRSIAIFLVGGLDIEDQKNVLRKVLIFTPCDLFVGWIKMEVYRSNREHKISWINKFPKILALFFLISSGIMSCLHIQGVENRASESVWEREREREKTNACTRAKCCVEFWH